MELSHLLIDQLFSFFFNRDFDTDGDIDAIIPLDKASNLKYSNNALERCISFDLSVTCCAFCCWPNSSAVDL